MAARNAMFGYFEMADGTTADAIRITVDDKKRLETTARANAWQQDTHAFTIACFLAWRAGARTGALPADMSWDDFLAGVVDAGVHSDVPADDQGVDDLDPTQTAPGTGSLQP